MKELHEMEEFKNLVEMNSIKVMNDLDEVAEKSKLEEINFKINVLVASLGLVLSLIPESEAQKAYEIALEGLNRNIKNARSLVDLVKKQMKDGLI